VSGRLREIARQTVAIAESGRYRNGAGDEVVIGGAVRAAVAGTRHYLPDDVLAVGDVEPGAGKVEVTYESTLQAAYRLGSGAACLVSEITHRLEHGGLLTQAQWADLNP
jgi:hypothetical protein